MNKITKEAARLCPSVLAGALLVAGLVPGCSDRPPPCNPEGAGNGGVTEPPPVFGPGGPGSPPDKAQDENGDAPEDAPDTYSTNAAGDVCICSPYQTGCSTTPEVKSCAKACNAGYARYHIYCQGEAPDGLRDKCEADAKRGLSSCLDTRRDKGCEGPCANLQLTFQTFCRDYANNDPCWSASNEGYGTCLSKG
jgi:hypothetical protein